MSDWPELTEKLEQGVKQGVAPAMVFLGWRAGEPAFCLAAGTADEQTVFDLASLTKPLGTALVALDLMVKGILPFETTLQDIWGPAVPPDKSGISVFRLLTHSAGFPAHRPFFNLLQDKAPLMRKGLLKAMLMNEPLEYAPGGQALYSDLGYMLLGLLLEDASGLGLDEAVQRVYQELKIEGPRFLPIDGPLPWPVERIAPCGSLPGRNDIRGQVEDENAHALGGVAGHAGLFGTAHQAAKVMGALSRAVKGNGPWPPEAVEKIFKIDQGTPGSTRTPGFDTPSGEQSAAGDNFPEGTVGHLGFTGGSLWWQPELDMGLVLLTNRVALGRDNQKIGPFRHEIHTLGWQALAGIRIAPCPAR